MGVFKADTWGGMCPQDTSLTGAGNDIPPQSEDCLNLNIWTAATSSRERRPVYVFAHGDLQWSAMSRYDGAALAREGLVVVTFNRQVGVFGCLAAPQLTAESEHSASGNYMLMDAIACLRWVRRNIAAFGGDPDRVTLAGQSAGAAMVFDLVCSPPAHGLFHRAQADGGVNYPKDPNLTWLAPKYLTLDQAEAKGAAVMEDLGVSTTIQLRAVAASELLTHSNDIGEYTLDGYVFPKTYTETLATGSQIDVPFLTGNNKDESRATPGHAVELATYTANAQSTYGPMAEGLLKLYPAADAGEQTNESIRDDERVSTFLWGRQWSAHATSPVHNYYWTHTPPGQESQGASHGSELNYMFANLYATDLAWTDTDRKIADTLSDYVVNFATTGNPNDAGLPRWRALDVADPGVMEIGDSFERIPLAGTEAKLDFFKP